MKLNIDETYILAYIKRDLPESEMKECDRLLHSSSDFYERVNNLKLSYQLFDNLDAQQNIDTQSAWRKLDKKKNRDRLMRIIWSYTRNVAAILLPLLLLHQFIVQPLLKEPDHQETITLYSAPGIVTKTILPDGSEVWLNSDSQLSYPNKFVSGNRTVNLVGEAYFVVRSHQKDRFDVVMPDKSVVSAYGTEFNVNSYKDDDYTITLTKGKVDVSSYNKSQTKTLIPGQKASINLKDNSLYVCDTDTYVDTAWKDGKMVFRRENISSIADRLSRKFGVIINIEGNEFPDYQFTATFTDETLEDILELLKLSTSIDYTIVAQEKYLNDTYSKRIITIKCK